MILLAFNYFPEDITSDTLWFILERTETLCNGTVRAPFDMTTLDKLFKTIYPNQLVYAIGNVRICQKNLPDSDFCFHSSSTARAFYYVLVIHILNYWGLLYDSIVSIAVCSGLAGA